MANSSKFRGDQVGSLLRPPSLLEAHRRLDAGMIDPEELKIVEDEAIAEAVKRQLAAGIDIITDGEYRRMDFRTGFVDAVEGIEERRRELPWRDSGGVATMPAKQFTVNGKIKRKRRITEGEVAYMRTLTKAPLKVTLLAPGFLVDTFWDDETSSEFYGSREEFAADVVAITKAEIEALIAEGVNYVQLDNPGYSAFLGEYAKHQDDAVLKERFERMLGADAAATDGIERHRTQSIGIHICRGNALSMWLGEGDYEPIAERLFSLPVNRFLLEYDSDRAGGFEPLRFVPDGKMVVLGLVSSKTPEMESIDELQTRIDEATRYVDWDFLALSPQCGFASVALQGNKLTTDQQYDKLQLVSDASLATWGIEL